MYLFVHPSSSPGDRAFFIRRPRPLSPAAHNTTTTTYTTITTGQESARASPALHGRSRSAGSAGLGPREFESEASKTMAPNDSTKIQNHGPPQARPRVDYVAGLMGSYTYFAKVASNSNSTSSPVGLWVMSEQSVAEAVMRLRREDPTYVLGVVQRIARKVAANASADPVPVGKEYFEVDVEVLVD
jgi:hypothetical protein